MEKYIIKNDIWCCGTMVENLVWRKSFESVDSALEEIHRYIRDDIEEEVSLYEEKKADLVPGLKMVVAFNTDAATREWMEIWEIEV